MWLSRRLDTLEAGETVQSEDHDASCIFHLIEPSLQRFTVQVTFTHCGSGVGEGLLLTRGR